MPLYSQAAPREMNASDSVQACLGYLRERLEWPAHLVLAKHIPWAAEMAAFLRINRGIAFINPSEGGSSASTTCELDGCPCCPAGERLTLDDYDPAADTLHYRGAGSSCARCPLAGTCPKQFEHDASENGACGGMIPSHTKLARRLREECGPLMDRAPASKKAQWFQKMAGHADPALLTTLCAISDIAATLEVMRKSSC